jgi:hypothetical protein
MLVGLSILLGTSSCQLTMSDLKALNPSAATLEVPCHPSVIPENVQRFAVQRGTGHIVTDEDQDELRNVAPLARVFIEVNPAATTSNARIMASDYGLSCPSLVNVDEPSSESWYVRPSPERAPLNSQFLASPTAPSTASAATAASGATSLPRIAQSSYSIRQKGIGA